MDAYDEMIVANRGDQPTYKELESELSASQAREAALREKLEAAEARIKASQEQEPFDYVYRGTEPVPTFLQPPIPPELAELQRENKQLRNELTVWVERFKGEEAMNTLAQNKIAELRKLLEKSKVPDWKSIIIDRLHSKVEVCMTCGQHKCPHVSNTTLPDTVQIDDVLWCINLDEHFFKESAPQPKEPKQ